MPHWLSRNSIIIFTACLFFTFFISCGEQQEEKAVSPSRKHVSIRIGLIPEQDIFSQKKRFEPLASYLSKKLGADIELVVLSGYGNIIDYFMANKLDAAFCGSFTGALAIKKLGAQPVARPEYADGTSTYYGLLFVRKDSGIHTAKDMQGKRFAFVDKATTAGWLLPLHYFAQNGITDYQSWFDETYFTGTHEDAIYDVVNGRADIGAAKNTVFSRLAQSDKRLLEELQVLASSPKVPANGLLLRKDIGEGLKAKLKMVLLDMDQERDGQKVLADFGAKRFVATTVMDFNPVFTYADQIGLNLALFDYK